MLTTRSSSRMTRHHASCPASAGMAPRRRIRIVLPLCGSQTEPTRSLMTRQQPNSERVDRRLQEGEIARCPEAGRQGARQVRQQHVRAELIIYSNAAGIWVRFTNLARDFSNLDEPAGQIPRRL